MQNQYITREQFESTLADLNYEASASKKIELLDRATADLEADLSKKFVIPLAPSAGGSYASMLQNPATKFAVSKVLSALKSKIREIIGYEKNRNLTGTIESTEKFINTASIEYRDQIRGLLDPLINYNFKLQGQADDAQSPVQHLALSKGHNKTDPFSGGGNSGLDRSGAGFF
jgi:hypothetical protein